MAQIIGMETLLSFRPRPAYLVMSQVMTLGTTPPTPTYRGTGGAVRAKAQPPQRLAVVLHIMWRALNSRGFHVT